MADDEALREQTQAYYEEEAKRQLRKAQYGRNAELRAEAIALFVAEGRGRVLDVGAGPGLDGEVFAAAGMRYVGIDLAIGNGHSANERGVDVVPASATRLPFGDNCFDAVWSMSTYMHLDADAMAEAARDLARVVDNDATCVVSMWGGERELTDHSDIAGKSRFYYLRPAEENTAIFAAHFTVASCRTWPDDHGLSWDQQVFVLRPR